LARSDCNPYLSLESGATRQQVGLNSHDPKTQAR